MATRIQLRRDVEDDWFRDNPILRSGEIGISLDLNTFKIGDGQTPWRDLDYALAGTIDEYIPLNQKSVPGGVAALDSAGKVPDSQIPAGIARDSEVSLAISTEVENRNSAITNAISNLIDTAPDALNTLNEIAAAINDDASYAATITTALGTKANLSDVTAATAAAAADATTKANAAQAAAASDATSKASAAQAAAISAAETDATTKANAAQAAAISAAATDATTKSSAAQAAAISAAATDATTKANAAQAAAITAAGTDATTKVEAEAALRVSGDAASVSTAAADATTKANAAQAAAISAAAADATTKANAAQSAAATDATTKANAAQAAAEATAAAALSSAISTEVSNRNSAISTAVDSLVDGAPSLLNTLNELAAAINDDANYTTTITTALGTKANSAQVTTDIAAAVSTAASDATTKANAAQAAAEATAAADATSKANAAQAAAEATAAAALSTHSADTTNIHGIADTSLLATTANVATAVSTAASDATTKANAAQAAAEATAAAANAAQQNGTTSFTAINYNDVAKQVAATTGNIAVAAETTAISWVAADYRSAKFVVKVKNGVHTQVSDLVVTLDTANNVAVSEYGITYSNGTELAAVSADYSGSDVRIRVTPANANTEVVVVGTLIK